MSENEETPFKSSLGFKYPAHRDDQTLCSDLWLEDKRMDDGAEGFWRIHDQLYDLTDWIDLHPGGRDWIRLTKGTDITEAYESHHVNPPPKKLLQKYFIRNTATPRNSPYTFKENGFYKTLQKRIKEPLQNIPKLATKRTKMITDLLLAAYVLTAILTTKKLFLFNEFYNFIFFVLILGAISGVLLSLTTIAAHNYFHQKDSFRMFYFDLSFLSSREWRISHAMSHHLYTNTVNDLEISLPQPFLTYLPSKNTAFRRIISWIISPFFYIFLFPGNVIKRYILIYKGIVKEFNSTEFIPYIIPVIMYILGGRPLLETLFIWFYIISVASFYFGLIGVNAAHHHPEIFHDGDTPRADKDWGLAQMDAVMDRHEITGSPFLVLTSFGDHALHHLFPTIDHGKLEYLYPVFKQTCQEFGVDFRVTTQYNLIVGQFYQLLRMTPNPFPPGQKWKWYKTVTLDLKNDVLNSFMFFSNKKT